MKHKLLFCFFIGVSFVLRAQDTTYVSLLFGGDVMGHDSQIASAYNPATKSYDYNPCFQFIKPYISAPDLAIANLEVTLAGPPYKGYPQFSSPDELAVTLKDAGFDALVTANNHSADRGRKGIVRTIKVLDSLGIPRTGTFLDSADRVSATPMMLYKNGFTIAILNYTYGTNGLPVHKPSIVNMLDTALIRRDILRAKEENPDVIVVFPHWGNEYERLPSKAQKMITEFCFKHGAMLVIGAHPHVIQPMEWRKDRNQFVAYSLGNFVSGQRKQYTDGGSMAYLRLRKVAFGTDSSTVAIDTAGYYLQWVYRTADADKDYYILPAANGDSKNYAYIKDAASRAAYDLFLKDSRALSSKHNVNVAEITVVPDKSEMRYAVLLLTTRGDEDPWKILTSQRAYVWGVDVIPDKDNVFHWTSGKFRSEAEAEKYRQRYAEQHPEARIVKVKEGKLVEQ